MNMEPNLGAPATCPIELVPNLGAPGGYSLPPLPIGRLRVLAASQVSMGCIKTDDELLLGCYDLYLKYSKAGKQELETLFMPFQGKVYQSDGESLDDDDIKDRILLKTLQLHKKKHSIAPHQFSPALEKSIQEALQDFYNYHIQADGLSWSELMYCRGDRSDEEIVTGLFYWVLQHPTCFSDYISILPTPTLLCKKPMTALSTSKDWLQAIYELAYGYTSPTDRVLAKQILFYEGQNEKERDEVLNGRIGGYTLVRNKFIQQRRASTSESEELWLATFIDTLRMAVQRQIHVSLMELIKNNKPPNWDVMRNFWMDAVDGKVDFIQALPNTPNIQHLPSQANSVTSEKSQSPEGGYKLYDHEYVIASIEERLGIHIVKGLLSHEERYKQVLLTLRAPSEAYSLTGDKLWSYVVNEVNRQFPLKDDGFDKSQTELKTDLHSELALNTGLSHEKERQGLSPQLFKLFEYLLDFRTVADIKALLWGDEADSHEPKEAQDKVSRLKSRLSHIESDWYVPEPLNNPTRYRVERLERITIEN